MIKPLIVAAVCGACFAAAPAFAGGSSKSNTLSIGAAVSTGKGGLLGSLLGTSTGHGSTAPIAIAAAVSAPKSGVLGLVLGSNNNSSSHHGGY